MRLRGALFMFIYHAFLDVCMLSDAWYKIKISVAYGGLWFPEISEAADGSEIFRVRGIRFNLFAEPPHIYG